MGFVVPVDGRTGFQHLTVGSCRRAPPSRRLGQFLCERRLHGVELVGVANDNGQCRAGFKNARAVASPKPEFAPVRTTCLPVRSALSVANAVARADNQSG